MDQSRSPAPRKRKKKYSGVSKVVNTLSYIIMILGASLLISAFCILLANDMFALVKDEQNILLVLDEKKTPAQVAEILTDNEIIDYGWAFKLFAKLKKIEVFETGKYEVGAGMDYGQIIDALTYATKIRETVTVTIPEGYSIRQIAEEMEKKGVCTREDFIETANTYKYSHSILKTVPMIENRLEGYLFPDTYEFYKNDNPVSVINKMLNNFVKKYTLEMRQITENREMTMGDIIIIASLIEREAKIANERTSISGVIYNRLNNPDSYPYLEIDATILYALPEHKDRLTAADLELKSPYNTYRNSGLPPTAICNPGLSSILAAISPEKHSYYFYVVDDPDTGSHVFSKTLKEHQANVAKYRDKTD